MTKLNALAKAKNAIKWVDKLETTDLKQGYEKLGDEIHGFCCLGLGCNLFELDFEPDEDNSTPFQELTGLQTANGDFVTEGNASNSIPVLDCDGDNNFARSLISLNDDYNHSFKDIAHKIKEHPEKLFVPLVAKILVNHWSKN